jgi:glucosamine kinase
MEAVLGIDGGATRTRAVLLSLNGQFLGYGQSGPSNYDNVGIKTARQNIAKAINQTLNEAGPPAPIIKAVFLGLAGVVSQPDRDVILEIASCIPFIKNANIQVDHDLRIALFGGLVGEPGIVLIVGTGCSCYGENSQGECLRVGGWGYLLDDYGGSYYLGLQALIATIRAEDGRIPPTLLSTKVMQRLEIPDVQNVMWRVYHMGFQPIEIAALAPLVIDAADQDDAMALQIIHNGVQELTLLCQTTAKRLGFFSREVNQQGVLNIVLTGGLVKSSQLYRESLISTIREEMPITQIQPPVLPPVFGAALLALHAAGISITPGLIDILKEGVTLSTAAGDSL